LLFGANTPWKRIRLIPGLGIRRNSSTILHPVGPVRRWSCRDGGALTGMLFTINGYSVLLELESQT
jgi:hypothetical protein